MNPEYVTLVDEKDQAIGQSEKLAAHQQGLLHRAFSIFLFNDEGKWLIQKRAATKYHSPNLWSNTCCGHPRPGEPTLHAAKRRLVEEMGIHCKLTYIDHYRYHAKVGDLTENEFDHLFVGFYANKPISNPEEINDWKEVTLEQLQNDISQDPEQFTVWFRLLMKQYGERLNGVNTRKSPI